MASDRWQRVAELFETAASLPPEQRAAYLDAASGGDPGLRREVEALLAAEGLASDVLKRAVAEAAREAAAGLPAAPSLAGRRIGPYELRRELGHGGMGAVYLAVRADDAYRKTVAIKLIRHGAEDPDTLHRFLAERQILATLDHPHIARLHDGGATEDGLPYVVMEHVEGEPLHTYCDQRRVGVTARLELFLKVCDAVQYAHRNLVVHRDLKPGNILVTAEGTPKLLDFGIAKLLEPPGATPATRTAVRLMTPEYASPEQVRGEPITTATDVYSLGVVLYELLTGQRPYQVAREAPGALERAICEQDPGRPSAVVGHAAEPVARARGLRPERLRRALAGDLDNIVLKALRKEPERRYASVEQLAADVRHHLEGRPVSARRDTFRYRAGKFVRRNAAGVGATLTTVAVVAGLTLSYTLRLARERDRVRIEAAKAAEVSSFLMELFEVSDPGHARGRDVTARELLDRGAGRIERQLAGEPAVRATMMRVIGAVYQRLGLYEEAGPLLEGALALADSADGDPLARAAALHEFGGLKLAKGDFAAADSLLTVALTLRRARPPFPSVELVGTLNDLGLTAQRRGQLPRADTLLSEAVGEARRLPTGEGNVEALGSALTLLGRLRQRQGRYTESDTLLREALERRRTELGEDHPSVGDALDALAETLRLDGRLEESEAMFREALAHGRRVLGNDHPTVTSRMGNLAIALDNQVKYPEALALKREVLVRSRTQLGPTHPFVAQTLNNLAATHSSMGNLAAASRLYREALAIHRGNYGAEHPSIATTLNNLAHALAEQLDHAGAVEHQRQALTIDRKLLGERHPYVGQDLVLVGVFLLAAGQVDAAEAPLREGVEILREALGPDHQANAVALYGLGKFLAVKRRFPEAREVVTEVLRIRRAALPAGHWETALAETLEGEVLAGLGRHAEAESLLVQGYDVVRQAQPSGSRNRTEARQRVVRFYVSRGAPERAAAVAP
ncbi:MAG: tetratricopeptide repeat protein [Gemmatimonadales bacterium]